MHNDTITLFNRYQTRDGDTWYATVVHGANVNIDRASIMAKYGTDSRDSVVLNIPYKLDGDNKTVAGKQWKPPKAWAADENRENYLTFNDGNTFDFFMIGQWDGETVISDDDYVADNSFYQYMNRTHDFVFAISAVGIYTVIPHFEILGK